MNKELFTNFEPMPAEPTASAKYVLQFGEAQQSGYGSLNSTCFRFWPPSGDCAVCFGFRAARLFVTCVCDMLLVLSGVDSQQYPSASYSRCMLRMVYRGHWHILPITRPPLQSETIKAYFACLSHMPRSFGCILQMMRARRILEGCMNAHDCSHANVEHIVDCQVCPNMRNPAVC